MRRRLSAVEARKRLGEVLEGVFYRGDEVVIERAGKPMAVVIPASLYEKLENDRQAARDRLFELVQMNWEKNKDVDPDEIQRDIDEAVREVRIEMRQEAERKKAKPE
jgi:prevent-host-death family protein